MPTLVLHGEDDQIVPIDDSARLSIKLLKNGKTANYLAVLQQRLKDKRRLRDQLGE